VPHDPGALDVYQPAVLPTPKEENCFASFVALQDGQVGAAEPCTIISKRWLHS
jgi:hypothetical protein